MAMGTDIWAAEIVLERRKDKSIDDLIKHCDKKLYDAKKRKA